MRTFLRIYLFSLVFLLGLTPDFSFAQLHYEGMVFDGMNKPLLENASSVAVSPDGNFVYATSYNDNAVTVYSRDEETTPGALTFVETQKDQVNGVVGLGGAFHLKISPDGNHLYVASSLDDALTVFQRNVVNGTLTYQTTYYNNVDGVEGIDGAYYVDIPVDGNHVYVAGPDENAVAVFQRNVVSGELTFVEFIQDESGDVTEMNYPIALMASPDGKHIYVSSFGDHAINVFERNLITGALSFVQHFKDGTAGISGLTSAYAPFVSYDGKHVYVTGLDANSVVAFDRDAGSGELTYIDTYVDGTNGVDGISGPTTVRSSKNGAYVFVAGSNEDAVAIFSRNVATGALNFISMVQNGVNGVSGIAYPNYLDISGNGENLYVTGFASASIGVFNINESTGNLDFLAAETGAGLGISGLDGSAAVTISPDANFVYVAGNNDDALVVFSRDEDSGALTFVQEIEDASATDGLNGISGMAISANGNYLYATGFWDKSIVLFERNNTTGELTYIERLKDGIAGVDGLNGANFVTISPDGANLYVTAFWDNGLSVFDINPANGKLTFKEVHKDGVLGVDGLSRASGVTISADGNYAYVAGNYDNAISMYSRDAAGSLSYMGIVKDGVGGVDGIQRVSSIVVSPNGAQVYATGTNDDALAIFNRDAATGTLTFVSQMKNGVGGVEGLDGPTHVTMSTDGTHIYVTSSNSDALAAFRRDVSNGELIFEAAQFDGVNGVNGLDGAEFVAVTPDGKHMYTAANVDDAVAVFSCTYILTQNQIICEGDSVVIGSSVYKTSGTYVDVFDFGACKSITTLELEVQPAMTTMDVEICGGDTYLFDGTTYNTTGTYTANFTSGNGCDSMVVLNLSIVNEFASSFVDASICQGDSYAWAGQEYTTTGTYNQSFTTAFGCDSSSVLNLVVNPVYEEMITAEICEGDFYVLGTQNYIASGTFVQNFTTATGCDSVITLDLTVIEPEMIINKTICNGEAFTIGGNDYTTAGTYNFTLASSAGCDSEVTLNLNVLNSYTDNLTASICQGETYILGNEVYSASGIYSETFTSQNGCDSTVTVDLVVNQTTTDLAVTICQGESYTVGTTSYSVSGDYTNILTAMSGCGDSTINLALIVEPTDLVLNESICAGESYTLGSTEYNATGMYVQTATSDAGCEISYTLNLTVGETFNMDVAETLCPGGSVTVGGETFAEAGNYMIEMTTSTGCDSIVNLSVSVSTAIETQETITDDNGTSNGAIDLTVTGGTAPYTFAWSNGEVTEDISNLMIGTYTVVVTDANNCSNGYSFEVDQINSTFEIDANIDVKVFPNPASVGGLANLSFNISENQTLLIQLYDATGRLISSEQTDFLSGNTLHKLRMPEVQGLYNLLIQTEEGKSKTIAVSVK